METNLVKISLEACFSKNNIPNKKTKWNKILKKKKQKQIVTIFLI